MRWTIIAALLLVVAGVAIYALLVLPEGEREAGSAPYADEIISGGVPRDGIPAIEDPAFESMEEADLHIADEEVVFLVDDPEGSRIYPRQVMVWHEIVNDDLDGIPVAVTYCPLTGSAIGFVREVGGNTTTFGTSGKLFNSNLVMYDRSTESLWSQILGTAVEGEMTGTALEPYPVIWTTWGLAKAARPGSLVLSRDTGHSRDYSSDPYGSYQDEDSYYRSGGPRFPVMNTDDRLPPKEIVTGVQVGNETFALRKETLREEGIYSFELGGKPLLAYYDPSLDTVRVFDRRVNGTPLSFTSDETGVSDGQTGSRWDEEGRAVSGPLAGSEMEDAAVFDLMWFGWVAFHPGTGLYASDGTMSEPSSSLRLKTLP